MALRRLATFANKGLVHLRPLSTTGCLITNSQVSRVRVPTRGFHSDSDVFDVFTPTRTVYQLISMMDQVVDPSSGYRRGWHIREDDDALHISLDMPGIGKQHVHISVDEYNTLIIKGLGEKVTDDEDQRRSYSSRIDLIPNAYKIDAIEAVMKYGVLKVTVPRLKYAERDDVFHVKVN